MFFFRSLECQLPFLLVVTMFFSSFFLLTTFFVIPKFFLSHTEIHTLCTKLTTLRHNFKDYIDVMAEQMDHMYQEIYTIHRFLGPDVERHGG